MRRILSKVHGRWGFPEPSARGSLESRLGAGFLAKGLMLLTVWAGFLMGLEVSNASQPPRNERQDPAQASAHTQRLVREIQDWLTHLEPVRGQPSTLSVDLELIEARGVPKGWVGQRLSAAVQLPDRWRLQTRVGGDTVEAGRVGQELWIWRPGKVFGVRGLPGLPRFLREPDRLDETRLSPLKLPVRRDVVPMLPLLFQFNSWKEVELDGKRCRQVRIQPLGAALRMFELEKFELDLWLDMHNWQPIQVAYRSLEDGFSGLVRLHQFEFSEPWDETRWRLDSSSQARLEKVALGHLDRFTPAALDVMFSHSAPLPPPDGERRLLREYGRGRLEIHDHTRVLFVKGSPQEMGEQQGILLRREIQDLVNRVLYGVGVGSSFEKGRWFFGEIESCQARIEPFIPGKYLTEMDALARAAQLSESEVRLANFFPELFHCSGFALFGQATRHGHMYHGRILDYLRGVGLEQNAVVIVHEPDDGLAWLNVGYAGFVGTVTAMNEKQLSIGEMGGRGEGNWDGVPMSQLLRMVMEQCGDLDEAIDLMRRTPRTCEYYYVLADGKSKRAVGIAATPESFELVWPGQTHPLLPNAFPDAVLLSAGDRYRELVTRVDAAYGEFDEISARALMTRPVAMNSNIQSVLFAPETLDVWVANADSRDVASETHYRRFNLGRLLNRSLAE